jgi:hypothetical protein
MNFKGITLSAKVSEDIKERSAILLANELHCRVTLMMSAKSEKLGSKVTHESPQIWVYMASSIIAPLNCSHSAKWGLLVY